MKLRLGILVASLLSFPIFADQDEIEHDTFIKLLEQGNIERAIQVAQTAIKNGNRHGHMHHSLAQIYRKGSYGIPRDEQKSSMFFELSIALGDYDAAKEYGQALVNGEDFAQNCESGMGYLHLANENQIEDAGAFLGSNYLSGLCVPQNFLIAQEYMEVPLQNNNPHALNTIGVAYFFGQGTDADHKKAFNYFERAAQHGSCNGQYHLAAMYDNGMYVDVDLEKAFSIFKSGHEEGCVQSTVGLANMYYLGRHVQVNNEQAFILYEQASLSGDLESLAMVATMLIDGIGVEQNPVRGIKLLNKAAERGDLEAHYHLGNYFFDGEYVEQSYSKAKEHYSASLENPFSEAGLGYLYEYGLGVQQNYELAETYYLGALKQGNIHAILALARWYMDGTYYTRDHDAALQLLEKGNSTQDDDIAALYAVLLACSADSSIQDIPKALKIIESQKKWKEDAHSYEVDLAEVIVLASMGDYERANVIIQTIESFYTSDKYRQFHKRQWHAYERFLKVKNDVNSYQRCSM